MPEPNLPLVGVVSTSSSSLWTATQNPAFRTRAFTLDSPVDPEVAGLVVDVPLDSRAAALSQLAATWQVPMLVDSPAADTVTALRDLADAARDRIVSANPLRYALHTRRLVEDLRAADDSLETFSVTLRHKGRSVPEDALPRLLDYLVDVCPDEIERIAALAHPDPPVQVVSLRYRGGTLGSLEVGAHFPSSFPAENELMVECYGRSRVFHCEPGRQVVSVYSDRSQRQVDWQPDPAAAIVETFATWLRGGRRPVGDLQRDLAALTTAAEIADVAATDGVITRR